MTTTAAAAGPPGLDRHRSTILDAATAVSVAAVSAVIVAQFVLPHGWQPYQLGVLAVGLLVGLPHGATDHLVAFRHSQRRTLSAIIPAYALTAVGGYAAFRAWPLPAVIVFAVISGWHFASGEVEFSALRRGGRGRRDLVMLPAFAAVIIVLPAALHAAGVDDVLRPLVKHTDYTMPQGWRQALLLFLVAVVSTAECTLLIRRRWIDVVEMGLLGALFLVVPPLAAFGVYFGWWHSVRHVARLIADYPPAEPPRTGYGLYLRRFGRESALPTAAALTLVAAMWFRSPNPTAFVSTDLAVLAGLTIPHMIVVAGQDRRTHVAEQGRPRSITTPERRARVMKGCMGLPTPTAASNDQLCRANVRTRGDSATKA